MHNPVPSALLNSDAERAIYAQAFGRRYGAVSVMPSAVAEQILTFMDFYAQATNPPAPPAGRVRFHSATTQGFTRFEQDNEGTTNIVLGRDNVLIAKNTTGSIIAARTPVYVTGSTGNVPNIGLAKSDAVATLPAVGVTLDAIGINAFGQVMKLGIIQNVNTSAFSTGDNLYVDPTTAGALTATRPVTPNLVQRIATVLVSGVGNGSLLIVTAPFVGGMEVGTTSATWKFNGFTLSMPADASVSGTNTGDNPGVTSIEVTGANGIGVSGSPITSSGTIGLSLGAITPTSVSTGTGQFTGAITATSVVNPLTTAAESWVGPSSTAGVYFKGGNVGIGAVNPGVKLDVEGGFITVDNSYGYLMADVSGINRYLIRYNGATNNVLLGDPSTSGGGVGVGGVIDPTFGGVAASKLSISQLDGSTSLAIGNATTPRFALNGFSDGSWTLYDYGAGSFTAGITQKSGKVGIGTTGATTIGNSNKLQVAGTTAATNSLGISAWSADALGSRIELGKSRGAAIGTNTIVQNNDVVASITGYGANGSTFTNLASISMEVDGTPGATTDMPGRVVISTVPDGSGTLTEGMRISQDQTALFASNVTAPRLTVTGSTVPVNGIYLPSANTVGFAANSALQATIVGTASASRYVTLAGSNGGNPTIATSAGDLAITPNVVGAGSFTSGAPTTGTAAPWKFGTLITGQVGLSLITTQYLEVDVSGALIRLATV